MRSQFYLSLYVIFLYPIVQTFAYNFPKNIYPYDPRIHNMGNIGILGKIHAECAPFFTRGIDILAYNGENIRQSIITPFEGKSMLDICCGVGYSTSLNENSLGIDTSPEMIDRAKRLFPNKNFTIDNAETFSVPDNFDITTCFFGFHEMPIYAWRKIIKNIEKITNEKIIIVDISPKYTPSAVMLYGEPYLTDYIAHINSKLSDFTEYIIKENHVHMWIKDL